MIAMTIMSSTRVKPLDAPDRRDPITRERVQVAGQGAADASGGESGSDAVVLRGFPVTVGCEWALPTVRRLTARTRKRPGMTKTGCEAASKALGSAMR
jgi:hypothetical protein